MRGHKRLCEVGRQVPEENHAAHLDALSTGGVWIAGWILKGRVEGEARAAIHGRVKNLEHQAFSRDHVWIVDPPVLV